MKHIKLSMLVAGAALIAAPFAAALPTLYYDIGAAGTDAFRRDQVAGEDTALGTVGAVAAGFTSSGYNVVSVASTKPATGTAPSPEMANTQLQITAPVGGSITIYFAESGFGPSSKSFLSQLSTTALASGATVTYTTYATTGALETGVGTLNLAALTAATQLTTQMLGALGANAVGGVLPAPLTGANPYNLIQKIVISTPNGGGVQLTANLQNVPDGGTTLALLGASLLGIGAVRRKLTK